METITSFSNPTIKQIKKLLIDKKERWEKQLFWVDGVNFVHQAKENGWEIEKIIYVPEKIDSDFKKQTLNLFPATKQLPVSIGVYESLAIKKDVQGVGALVKMKHQKNSLGLGFGVVLENLQTPGNIGTIMRTGVAFGVKNLYVVTPGADVYAPESVRASMGAIFHLNIFVVDDVTIFAGKNNLGTTLQGETLDLEKYRLENLNNTFLWFGNEARGMSERSRSLCQTLLKVPISQNVDSLNVSESAAIFLYELMGKISPS